MIHKHQRWKYVHVFVRKRWERDEDLWVGFASTLALNKLSSNTKLSHDAQPMQQFTAMTQEKFQQKSEAEQNSQTQTNAWKLI